MGMLEGKVVAVTGAGGGLGRAHALLMAREGAKVVVNDLGGQANGSGKSGRLADLVVTEIKEAGGDAVANYASVSDPEGAQSIVDDAVNHFGRLDVVVNNAGILRDKTLVKMTREMWDSVIDVHLTGTFLVTKAAFEQMLKQGEGGRIINTSSLAGLIGNFGQTNYGAAKAGIAGLTRVVALEGRRDGITVNAIAPVAKTRMTEAIEAVPEQMEPEDVSPLVVWLASEEAAEVTGRVFGAHGSHYFEYVTQRTDGVDLGDERWEPAAVGQRFEAITALATPGAGGGGADDQVRALFAALPATLRADRAGGWQATIEFDVKGTGTYTIAVADGQASFTEGPADSPDGKVTFESADVLLQMARGKLKPEQAFMSGKIGSNNMDILMKFGKFFDLGKAAEAIGGAAGGGGPADQVRALFAALPEVYDGGWSCRLAFEVKGTGDFGLIVADTGAEFVDGAPDDAEAKVSFDSAELVLDLARGKTKAEQAFMSGKISSNNMGALMKFGKYFDLTKAAETALAGGQEEAAAGGGHGLNRDMLGHKYKGSASFVEAEQIVAFAEATDDRNPRYVDVGRDGGIVAPPLFAQRFLHTVMEQALVDEQLGADLLRLVHGEQDMVFHRPLRPWDLAAARAEIAAIEDKSSGQLLEVRQWLVVSGETVCESTSGLFIRGEGGGGSSAKAESKKPDVAEPADREIVHTASKTVADDQPLRYAEASGDHNPIHTDPQVARSAGLPGVILHGMCTMAFAQKALVDGLLGGDPDRLKRLRVRFAKPVFPGDTITTRMWRQDAEAGRTTFGLEAVNQDGTVVLSHGIAETIG